MKKYVGEMIQEVRFPINLWHLGSNLSPEFPRTNSAIEGWHAVFKANLVQ